MSRITIGFLFQDGQPAPSLDFLETEQVEVPALRFLADNQATEYLLKDKTDSHVPHVVRYMTPWELKHDGSYYRTIEFALPSGDKAVIWQEIVTE